jgi:hypothetical protein
MTASGRRERRRVLVAISHPQIASGLMHLLKLDRRYEVRGATAEEAGAIARDWDAEAVLADAPIARRLPRELAPRIMVAAAGDGLLAKAAAEEIGAATWVYLDTVARALDAFLREPPALSGYLPPR